MTDSSTPETGAEQEPAATKATAATRTRRRAASRPAGPPTGGDGDVQAPTAGDAQAASGDAASTPAPATGASRTTKAAKATKATTKTAKATKAAKTTRATKTTKAATAGAEASQGTAAGRVAVVPEGGDEAAPAPAKKAARKRTAKKTAPAQRSDSDTGMTTESDTTTGPTTGTTDSVSDGAPAPASTEAAPGDGGAVPAKATRKRASRTRTTATTTDRPVLPGSAEDTPAAALPGAGPTASTDAVAGAATDDEQEAGRAGVGAAAVLFQAPDPVAAPRRRRRASAPAGPPTAVHDELGEPPTSPQAVTPEDDSAGAAQGGAESDRDEEQGGGRKRRRRGGRGRRRRGDGDTPDAAHDEGQGSGDGQGTTSGTVDGAGDDRDQHDHDQHDHDRHDHDQHDHASDEHDEHDDEGSSSSRRRRRRRRRAGSGADGATEDPPGTVTKVRQGRKSNDEVASVKGSTRLEAKKQRRRDGREAGRRKQIITESEFLARRESVERTMIVRERSGRTQIAVLEDDVLVEHYVANETNTSMIGNVYLGRVQNVLPSMEAAFVDIGKGRNAVLYAGEVNWDAAGLEGQPRRIEQALKSGDTVLVQVTKDPLGHKGARLTSQISLPGRYLVYVPNSSMTGISRKLPDTERSRLKKILKGVVPEDAGVIVRTAAEGASEEELARDVTRLSAQWEDIQKKSGSNAGGSAPKLLHGEPDLTIRVVRDVFNEDFAQLVVSGAAAWDVVQPYLQQVAPDLAERASRWTSEDDVFAAHRVDEQLAKAMDRKVYLPSGGSLVIDRTEAMTVVDVNTGKFTGAGGNLEETVTRNNLEAAEEIVRQLRLRDIGGIIVVDFIDMVLESNRDLVLRRLVECLGRDRTKHQVAEVTSLGLVQMTRKRVGQGLVEVFSEPCEHCNGRGIIIHSEPVSKNGSGNGGSGGSASSSGGGSGSSGRRRGKNSSGSGGSASSPSTSTAQPPRGPIPAGLVASLARHSEHHDEHEHDQHDRHDEPEQHDEDVVPALRDDAPSGSSAQVPPVGEASAVAEQQAVAHQQPAIDQQAVIVQPASEGSTRDATPDAPGEAAVADLSAEPAAPPKRRRRRASAPAGPPSPTS